jgi:hypothetical protein
MDVPSLCGFKIGWGFMKRVFEAESTRLLNSWSSSHGQLIGKMNRLILSDVSIVEQLVPHRQCNYMIMNSCYWWRRVWLLCQTPRGCFKISSVSSGDKSKWDGGWNRCWTHKQSLVYGFSLDGFSSLGVEWRWSPLSMHGKYRIFFRSRIEAGDLRIAC